MTNVVAWSLSLSLSLALVFQRVTAYINVHPGEWKTKEEEREFDVRKSGVEGEYELNARSMADLVFV